jgi:hypothetical protein
MDNYIDNGETQEYGPRLRANLARAFADATGPVAATIKWIVTGQQAVDESMADEKSPVVVKTRRLMVGFYKHLDSKLDVEEWSGDLDFFFPGGRKGVSPYAGPLLTSVDVTLKALKTDPSVPEHDKFTDRLKKARKNLDAHITASGDAAHGARGGLSEQSAEKQAWLREYRGNVLIIEGLLQKLGRSDELHAIVPHLAAPGARKATDAAKSNTAEPKPATP